MDTAKVRIQTQPPPSSEGGKLYGSTLHCIRSIVKTEGASVTKLATLSISEIPLEFWEIFSYVNHVN